MHSNVGTDALPLRTLRSGRLHNGRQRLSDTVEGGAAVSGRRRGHHGAESGGHAGDMLPAIGAGQEHPQLHRFGASGGRHLRDGGDFLPHARLGSGARVTAVRTGRGAILCGRVSNW